MESPHFANEHGGLNPQELFRLGLDPAEVIDFSVNSNPFGPSPAVLAAVRALDISTYPDQNCYRLRESLAEWNQVGIDNILAGNGSAEVIWTIAQAFLKAGDAVVIAAPTFGEYQRAATALGAQVISVSAQPPQFKVDLKEVLKAATAQQARLVFLCNPNNPTGQFIPDAEITALEQSLPPGCLLVLDEAYRAFVPGIALPHPFGDQTILLRSMTKDFALAGLRLGYAIARSEIITELSRFQPTWSVNSLAQAAGCAVRKELPYYQDTWQRLEEIKTGLFSTLAAENYDVLAADVHFALIRTNEAAGKVREQLLSRSILVRDCASFGLPQYIRVSARLPEQNQKLINAFAEIRSSLEIDHSVSKKDK